MVTKAAGATRMRIAATAWCAVLARCGTATAKGAASATTACMQRMFAVSTFCVDLMGCAAGVTWVTSAVERARAFSIVDQACTAVATSAVARVIAVTRVTTTRAVARVYSAGPAMTARWVKMVMCVPRQRTATRIQTNLWTLMSAARAKPTRYASDPAAPKRPASQSASRPGSASAENTATPATIARTVRGTCSAVRWVCATAATMLIRARWTSIAA